LLKGGNSNGKTENGRGMKRKLPVVVDTELALICITILS
jgi:hypothetical protein